MRRYRKWALTLGIMAVTPGIAAAAGPLSLFKGKAEAVTESAAPSNQKIADEIGKALRAAQLRGYDIEIEYKNGVAILTGKITDSRQKANATRVVSQVDGVKRVDNQLVVLQQGAGATGAARTNPSTPSSRLAASGRAPSSPLAAPVASRTRKPSSIQQVSGEVPAPPESPSDIREAATTAAIQNNQEVAQQIANALSAARLNGYDIEIRYQNGIAVLGGSVASPEQRAAAAQVAQRVPGVRMVNNQLLVQGPAGGAPSAMPQQPPVFPASMSAMAQPGGPQPVPYGGADNMSNAVYDMPHLPENSWPTYASYPNYAQVAYPTQYSASAWPYIGPFYPYPQVPLGWRKVTLEWDDGNWNLSFNSKTDKWYWFLHPKNW